MCRGLSYCKSNFSLSHIFVRISSLSFIPVQLFLNGGKFFGIGFIVVALFSQRIYRSKMPIHDLRYCGFCFLCGYPGGRQDFSKLGLG